MQPNPYQYPARLLRALSHPIRLHLLDLLNGGEECVCHLTAITGKRQAYVSQQLAALRRSGLVQVRKEGLRVYYRASDARAHALVKALMPARKLSHRARGCACPKCRGCEKTRTEERRAARKRATRSRLAHE